MPKIEITFENPESMTASLHIDQELLATAPAYLSLAGHLLIKGETQIALGEKKEPRITIVIPVAGKSEMEIRVGNLSNPKEQGIMLGYFLISRAFRIWLGMDAMFQGMESMAQAISGKQKQASVARLILPGNMNLGGGQN